MKLLLWLVIFIINTIIITTIADWIVMGMAVPALKKKKFDKEYIMHDKNRQAFQRSTECSGFSLAYVLRSLGTAEADGNDMYAKMPGKLKNGAVLPKNLKKVAKQHGLRVRYVKGNIETLKAELCEGKRVIALVKTRIDKEWLHYVPVVGYDEANIFIADSLRELANCKDEHYNRKLSNSEFLRIWDTRAWYLPFYKNTYLVLERNLKE